MDSLIVRRETFQTQQFDSPRPERSVSVSRRTDECDGRTDEDFSGRLGEPETSDAATGGSDMETEAELLSAPVCETRCPAV